MSRSSFPEIPQDALKRHGQPERIERVWRRLELDLSRAPRVSRSWWWAPAAAAGIFGLGVMVGARWNAPVAEMSAVAEPRPLPAMPGAGPVREPRAPAAEQKDAPEPKPARPQRPPRADLVADEVYPEVYGEPAATLSASASDSAAAPAGPAEWERLAEASDFTAAKVALEREGGFQPAVGRASASQLMVLADIARAVGSREQAMLALKRVLLAYAAAPEAPIAAWTLGNLLEQAGDRVGAAEAYATYRRLSPAGDFAEDAAARQVDAALSQGNLELASRAVEEYAQNFPKGRRLAELRKRLLSLAAPADAPSDGAEPEEDDEALEPGAQVAAPPPASEH